MTGRLSSSSHNVEQSPCSVDCDSNLARVALSVCEKGDPVQPDKVTVPNEQDYPSSSGANSTRQRRYPQAKLVNA